MADPATTAAVAAAASSGGWIARDYLYLAGVIVSLIAATIAFFSARMTISRDQNSLGDSEIKLFELIAKCEAELLNFNVGIKKEAEKLGDAYVVDSADNMKLTFLIESVLNSYDIACQRYLDGKLDKNRFRKTYSDRIRNLCKNSLYQPVIVASALHYSALSKVNIELNDPEK